MSEFHESDGVHDSAGYALNALDAAELAAFEEHLPGCESCQREVAEFAETTAQLALLSEEAPAVELRASVLSAIGGIRQLPADEVDSGEVDSSEVDPGEVDPGEVESGEVESDQAPADPAPANQAPADELAARRSQEKRRRSSVVRLGVAAAMALILGLGGWIWGYNQHREQQVAVAGASAANRLLSAPDVRTYPVSLKDGTPATFVVSKSLNQAMFVGADLPAAEPGRTYQLWTVTTSAVPNVTFAGGPETTQFMTGDIAGAAGLAISSEPAGGSKQPSDVLGQTKLSS